MFPAYTLTTNYTTENIKDNLKPKSAGVYYLQSVKYMQLINMRNGNRSVHRHLHALSNKRNYCIHVYLFVQERMHLFIGLTVMHI